MAGGSQIIISSDGITIKTPREFKVFAGQHVFESGAKVEVDIPILPFSQSNSLCALKSRFGEDKNTKNDEE